MTGYEKGPVIPSHDMQNNMEPINTLPGLPEYPMEYNPQTVPVNLKAAKKQKFTPEEDEMLKRAVAQHGSDWKMIAATFPNRNARQCRDRWKNYLAPSISHTPWTAEEDRILVQKIQEYGRQWAIIAKFFPGRTDIHIKNRWVTISNKLGIPQAQNMQVDPSEIIPGVTIIDNMMKQESQ